MNLEPLHPIQIARFRAMTAQEKWDVAKGLLGTARATRRAAILQNNPSWTPDMVEKELAREIACART